jgi:AhpD family alkylhydroperoxidase
VRDLQFGETALAPRKKALIGLGVTSAIGCPYCTHFHTEEARLAEVTEDELAEATAIAGTTQYFSTVLHGAETDIDEFVDETAEIVDHIEQQEAATAND